MAEEPDKELTPIAAGEKTNYSDGIFDRKTARQFSSNKVTQEHIDLILKAAFAAPTGGNQRSWEFIVVTDKNLMLDMKQGNSYSQALDTAPLVIVIAVSPQTAAYPELLTMDAGIAAQSILVQASKLGLASVPMSIAPQKARIDGVSRALHIPADIVPHIMICIGQPLTDAVSSASTNFYDERKVHYNRY
ncbi:MAG: nitroreductase family protein [Treponema sp.]|jgi:nitroreductase|nr:nitroreductase family protein [Treponema sp.]